MQTGLHWAAPPSTEQYRTDCQALRTAEKYAVAKAHWIAMTGNGAEEEMARGSGM